MELNKRYDFVYLFDIKDGNPNGDPDAGNLPRVDAETGNGLVTDVCLKRKVRNYVGLAKGEQPPYEIYIKEKAVLNNQNERAYKALNIDLGGDEGKRKAAITVPWVENSPFPMGFIVPMVLFLHPWQIRQAFRKRI